jgi:hypothetical protein
MPGTTLPLSIDMWGKWNSILSANNNLWLNQHYLVHNPYIKQPGVKGFCYSKSLTGILKSGRFNVNFSIDIEIDTFKFLHGFYYGVCSELSSFPDIHPRSAVLTFLDQTCLLNSTCIFLVIGSEMEYRCTV